MSNQIITVPMSGCWLILFLLLGKVKLPTALWHFSVMAVIIIVLVEGLTIEICSIDINDPFGKRVTREGLFLHVASIS